MEEQSEKMSDEMKSTLRLLSIALIAVVVVTVIVIQAFQHDGDYSTFIEQQFSEIPLVEGGTMAAIRTTPPETTNEATSETSTMKEESSEATLSSTTASSTSTSTETTMSTASEETSSPVSMTETTTSTSDNSINTTPSIKQWGALIEENTRPWTILDQTKRSDFQYHWQTIIVQNENKLDYTIIPQGQSQWQVMLDGRNIKVKFDSELEKEQDILSRKKQGKYAVQLISLEEKQYVQALELIQMLVSDGYYAYIYKTKHQYNEQYWYRIRVGFFTTVQEAQVVGQEIYQRYRSLEVFPKTYWAVLPSTVELSKDLIDLQAYSNKPWLIEWTSKLALEKIKPLLRRLESKASFWTLARKYSVEDPTQIEYRLRIGFFETEALAKKKLPSLKRLHRSFNSMTISNVH